MRGALLGILLTAVAVGSASSVQAQSVYAVDRDQVNVRADATAQAERVGVLRRGEQVTALRRHEQWLEVRLPGGGSGWIHSQLLRQRYLVEGQGVRLRDGPSTRNTSVTMLFRGQEVDRLAQRGSWTQVRLGDGRSGWVSTRYLRAKTAADLAGERPAPTPPSSGASAPATLPAPAPSAPEVSAAAPADSDEFAILLRNPYAEGLQHEASGDHAGALARFDEVLAADPEHVNALVHSAQALRNLGEYKEALGRLYRALEIAGGRRDIHLTLGEIYRLRAEPDSAAKYQALFRGQTPQPSRPEAEPEVATVVEDLRPLPELASRAGSPGEEATGDARSSMVGSTWLLIGMAGVGLMALAGVAWWVVSTSSGERRPRPEGTGAAGRFGRVWKREEEEAREGKATPEEEAELDRQIDGKWRELRESVEAFAPGSATAPREGVDGVLDQVEGLRRTLEGQDERARIYADIVRLQNMKIEAMNEEIRRLRKGRG